jgi:2-polyprenyl-6-methoxyphenol hydroxylase-like FAD-dependent oxidoreductase
MPERLMPEASPAEAAETVLVLGAGIAGLCTALALAPSGRAIVLLERDEPPPEGGVQAVFDRWNRRGASQLRHSHAFLARLRQLIADEHPDLLAALQAAGARELRFADGVPDPIKPTYRPVPADEEMAILVSRRTTLEMVIRAHVERVPNVTIRSGVFVSGLITDRDEAGRLVARGLRLQDGETLRGDLIVDAGGRTSPIAEWLAEAGAPPAETSEDCRILYYTRFYEFEPGQSDPPRGRHAPNGDLGYLKFGVFPADNGTFSITMAVPEVEEEMRAAVVQPDVFETICTRMPGLAPWTDPARARPVSKVHAMGDLKSRWREMAPGGAPLALNLFLVGDSLVRTNPLYGRGCSFAAIEAHALRDVLAETADPVRRCALYSARARSLLQPYFDDMCSQDRAAARRAEHGLDRAHKPSLRGRLLKRIIEDGVAVAIRSDLELYRAAMRAFHMLEPPRAWLSRPANLAKVIAVMLRGRKANAHLYAETPGPDRWEMFGLLGLDSAADLARLTAAA